MSDADQNYPLALLRAELGTVVANLKVDLVREFAAKSETARLEKKLDEELAAIHTRVSKIAAFQNKVAGALVGGAFLIPVATTLLFKYVG